MSDLSFTILGIIVDIVSLGVAMYTFIVTSRLEREATEEQTHRERGSQVINLRSQGDTS